MHAVVSIGVRVVLLLCSAVVLGLSVTLAKHQVVGSVPSETGFGSFLGAFGIIVAALGIVAALVDRFPGLVTLIADGIAAVLFLAGGIALAIAMKGTSCTDDTAQSGRDRFFNKIINGGCEANGYCYPGGDYNSELQDGKTQDSLRGRCTRAQADFAFEFIACVFCLGCLAMTFLMKKNSGRAVYA